MSRTRTNNPAVGNFGETTEDTRLEPYQILCGEYESQVSIRCKF